MSDRYIDSPVIVTFFDSYAASTKTEEICTLTGLADRIQAITATQKKKLPWLKLARFGENRTDANSLRHDNNLVAVSGLEADYDGGLMTLDEATEILTEAKVEAAVYTSPSYTEAAPRWRVLCPFSAEYPPQNRDKFMGRLNGLFKGAFATESWTLSQSYYFGSVNSNPSHRVVLIAGTRIDLHDDLDEIWQGKPNTATGETGDGQPRTGPMDEAAVLAEITKGISYHASAVRLLGRWAMQGVPLMEARARLTDAFDGVFPPDRDARWKARRADVDRCLMDIYAKEARVKDMGKTQASEPESDILSDPDMNVLRLGRRAPPAFPLAVLGDRWWTWLKTTTESAACPVDNVVAPLLAAASVLIGHARWAQAAPGWAEPPHLWLGVVGDSGTGKSPGADALLRDVLPEIERRMVGDFPDRLAQWRATAEVHAATIERWKNQVRSAQKAGDSPPLPPVGEAPPEPQAPRLRQTDVTIEKLATLLANAAPKGVLVVRDELSGWLLGLNSYNDAGRAFWIEAYGGRPYRVERQKHPQPIVVARLAVAVTGGTQPEKLAELFRDADDGLLARIAWVWPNPIPFRLGRVAPATDWAVAALDRLRQLDLTTSSDPNDPAKPIMVPLAAEVQPVIEAFGQDMQRLQEEAGGLLRSAYGKARGLALRLSLVIEYMWWCAQDGMSPPPAVIGMPAFEAAALLVRDYLLPMAMRVYGDAATRPEERGAATLARWIVKTRAGEVHVRKLQREVRLPGLGDAETIHAAANVLVAAGWLIAPVIGFGTKRRVAYTVNSRVLELAE